MTDLEAEINSRYMTRQELYREACTPREDLDEHFINSLTFRIIQDDPGHHDAEIDNRVCDNWCVALRSAIGEAWEEYRAAEHRIHRGEFSYATQEAFGRRYLAMKVIRNIAREMYRHTVPADERVM